MKKMRPRAFLCLILAGLLTLGGCGTKPVPPEPDISDPGETETSGGSSEPVPTRIRVQKNGLALDLQNAVSGELSMERIVSLLHEMNVKAVHLTFSVADLLREDGTVREDIREKYRPWLEAIRQAGCEDLTLTVRGAYRKNSASKDLFSFPYPDSGNGAQDSYYQFLLYYGEQIAALAQAYPEVTMWQTGGGYDSGEDMAHPASGNGEDFYPSERADINLDLAVAAKRAFADHGLQKNVILGAFSLGENATGAVNFLKETYRYLASGASPFGKLTPAECFDAVSWKPIVTWYRFDAEKFLASNERLSAVMKDAGDTSSPVLLTEIGFPDYGSQVYDAQQAEWLGEVMKTVSAIRNVTCAVYFSTLFETEGGENEHRGLFRVFDKGSFGAKEKAVGLCREYGGNINNLNQYIGEHVVYQNQTLDKNAVNGIGFAIKGADERNLDISKIMDLLQVMNVQCMRNWMNIRTLLTSPTTINSTEVAKQKQWIAMLNSRGITKIIGMSQGSFWNRNDELAVPYRDVSDGSEYMQFLESYRQSWQTLAGTFPEILYWEVGNEPNHDPFLHPVDYSTRNTRFTVDEKAKITVDMMYYAAQGVKAANPDATVIFPALTPTNGFSSMKTFLEKCYQYIESGNALGGTDPDAYFDAAAWHMYYFQTSFTPENWLEGHNSVHQVMVDHGDGEKKVFITEFGFSDGGSQEKDQNGAQAFREIFGLLSQMPYIDSLYPFRMIEDETAVEWGGTIEIYYGMFRVFDAEHFGAKEKAKAICEIYGGDLSALDRYIGRNQVYPR